MASGQISADRQKLCHDFAEITASDPGLAEYYLNQSSWNFEDAVNTFLDYKCNLFLPPWCKTTAPSGNETASTSAADESKGHTPSSNNVRLITWNIDGLDERNVLERTRAVCRILKSHSPDVVFLQEVIPETCQLITAQLSNYKAVPASKSSYFTLVLLKESTVTDLSSQIENFLGSKMGRMLQIVDCKCCGIDLRLMCSHLESTTNGAAQRKVQFGKVLQAMTTSREEQTVLFGGDTNLRDKEVAKVGLPESVRDVWEMCGSPPSTEYTWDLSKNDNLDWRYPNRPKLRFDRLYLRDAVAPRPKLEPDKFVFVGTDRLGSCGRFPSDHWGILVDFTVTHP